MWKGIGRVAAIGAAFLSSADAHPPGWEKLEGCQLVEGRHNDGDSVEAEYRGQRHVFRLYFVDTIEKHPESRARRAGQAKYFDLKGEDAEVHALQTAYAAAAFTEKQLRKPFTVYTRWEKVDPKKNNPSLRAFITTANGRDLSMELVRHGLAIIRSGRRSTADHPEGPLIDETLRDLRQAETEAHLAGRGAWAFSKLDTKPETAPTATVAATNRKGLLALAGHRARVQGRISRIGALADGRITFLNFEGNAREDFVAIIRAGSLPVLRNHFPNGLEQALVGHEVIMEGLVTLFRDTPQMEIESPAQISIVPEPASR
jgi:endonuclease YncB( thermonuclease family)